MTRPNQATEQMSLEDALARLPAVCEHLDKVLARLSRIAPLPAGARLLDIGAAQGLLLVAGAERGLDSVGVEPWGPAREVAGRIGARLGLGVKVVPGTAEHVPLPSESFDLVHANSVFEHVADPQAMLAEAHRVLRPGGWFWFSAASSASPFQEEISGFPFFGWYPDRLKRRIMGWAKTHRPALVGHTDAPAVNWLTPRKARRMLTAAGFTRVYDRWDLRLPAEGGRLHRLALTLVHHAPLGKPVADALVSACSYAAVKGG